MLHCFVFLIGLLQLQSSCLDVVGFYVKDPASLYTVMLLGRELQMQKLKSHLLRTQSLNILHLKPGVGQHLAVHATLTARDFFLAYFYPSSPFTCIFSKTSPDFSCVGCG